MGDLDPTKSYVVDRRSGALEPAPDYSDPDLIPLSPEADEEIRGYGPPDEVVVLGEDSVVLQWKRFRVDPEVEVNRLCGGLDDDCSDAEKEEIRWRNVRPDEVVRVGAAEVYLALPLAVVDGFFKLLGTRCVSDDSDGSVADVDPNTTTDTVCMVIAGSKTLACEGDEDGDLIPNNKDECPTEYGPNSNKGCPEKPVEDASPLDVTTDTDADCEKMTIGDGKEVCVDGDEDGDGTKNAFDACPEKPGPSWKKGCPSVNHVCDSDGNGFIDDDQIPDPVLRQAIKDKLGLESQEAISLTQAAEIWSFSKNSSSLTNLQGIQCFPNLKVLNLTDNQISDLAPIQGMVSLNYLWIPYNQISDLAPLQGLVNLERLDLNYNQISEIGALLVNPGLGVGDSIWLWGNPGIPLTQIDQLCAKGPNVHYPDADDLYCD